MAHEPAYEKVALGHHGLGQSGLFPHALCGAGELPWVWDLTRPPGPLH